MNVLLVGGESAGVQTLRLLAGTAHRVVAVLTAEPARSGPWGATLADVATALGCDVRPPDLVTRPAFASVVRDLEVDVLLNVHSLHVVHPDVVTVPRIGAFNLHPGPLPAYAGLDAPSWAILRGEATHGVTVHWMDAGIDTGPIAYQATFALDGTDTGLSVARRCVRAGMALIAELLTTAASRPSEIPRVAQDLRRRTYVRREVPHHGEVDWARPAGTLDAMVRAFDYHPLPSPWGTPRTHDGHRAIGIARVRRTHVAADAPPGTVGIARDDGVAVACADQWLTVTHVVHDARRVPALGHLRPGTVLGDRGESAAPAQTK